VGEQFTFECRHYTPVESPALPKPVQTPGPMVIGGMGRRRTPELAVRYASEFTSLRVRPGVGQPVRERPCRG